MIEGWALSKQRLKMDVKGDATRVKWIELF